MRRATFLTTMIILATGAATSVEAAKWNRRHATVRQVPLGSMSRARLWARRNSVMGDFRSQLQPDMQKVWDKLKPGQRLDVLQDAAAKGGISWTQYLDAREEAGKAYVFEASTLNQKPQNYTFLGKDTGHPRSKFVVVRDLLPRMVIDQGQVPTDRKGQPLVTAEELKDPRVIDHSVSVATPNGKQPVWLHQVDRKGAHHLGRMVRDALGTLQRTHGVNWATKAYINMPGMITIPRLHAHGVWKGNDATISDWDGFIKSNRYQALGRGNTDYQLYQVPSDSRGRAKRLPIVAVASKAHGSTAQLSGANDALLGKMILDVANAALKSGMQGALERGRIEIDSTDNRLVVRLYERPMSQRGE